MLYLCVMAYKSLRAFIDALEQAGELIRIKEYVNPELEIAEITDRISKAGNRNKALLFENTGTQFPLLINSMGSDKRMCMALGINHLDDAMNDVDALLKNMSTPKNGLLEKLAMLPQLGKFASYMPKVVNGRGACQEVVMANPDLGKLPVLKCWPQDGGPFITLPAIHTKDPNTGMRNIGMYRMQVFEPTMTGMHWHRHKVSARHYNEYKKLGKRMPVAVALGGDPVYTYAATAPLPENVDEYMLAGFLRKKKVELVRCISQPEIEVPADADFIIEGYVDPAEELIWEGPFGDHTGYYSLPDWYPRFHVTAITHRKDAVYPATIVGIPPQEDAWIGKATERIFLTPIKMTMVPEIADMNMPVEGVFHNLVIATINKEYPGQGQKVMNAMWGAGQMMFNKILVLADGAAASGIKIDDYKNLAIDIFNNLNPVTDVYFSQGPMDVLDHSCSKMGFGGKMCIDGTRKTEEEISAPLAAYKMPAGFSVNDLKVAFSEITSISDALMQMGIPVLFVGMQKNKKGHVGDLHRQLCEQQSLEGVKMILYVEHTVNANDIADVLWRFCNNLDPRRDHFYANAILGLDGTRKTKKYDSFDRPWPNVIAADNVTIEAVDKKWSSLGLGDLLISPSLRYQTQLYGGGATVLDNE